MYCYSDTDSIHTLLPIEECKKFCDIDDYKLYYWKHESSFIKARFVRQKTYVEVFEESLKVNKKIKNTKYKLIKQNKIKNTLKKHGFMWKNKDILRENLKITCAGMPKRCYKHVTFDNFRTGFTCDDKLKFTHVKRWCNFAEYRIYNKR